MLLGIAVIKQRTLFFLIEVLSYVIVIHWWQTHLLSTRHVAFDVSVDVQMSPSSAFVFNGLVIRQETYSTREDKYRDTDSDESANIHFNYKCFPKHLIWTHATGRSATVVHHTND